MSFSIFKRSLMPALCALTLACCIHSNASADNSGSSSSVLLDSAPPFISSESGKPVMKIAVVNRTHKVSRHLLKETLKAVRKQVKRDFAPYYGIGVEFRVYDHTEEVNWYDHVPLIIVNELLMDPFPGTVSFHDIQPDPDSNLVTGDPISFWIPNPPTLPVARPYIIIPLGTENTDYGIIPVTELNLPFLPPTFEGLFSEAVSHEVLETLHNYTLAQWTNTLSLGDGDPCEPFFDFYLQEVCDPVELSPGYTIDGVYVSNFVLPSYWVPNLNVAPFDYLNTVQNPLTPYQGVQEILEFGPCNNCEAEALLYVSLPAPFDPGSPFFIPLESLCPCDVPAAVKGNAPNLTAGPHHHPFNVMPPNKAA